MKTPYASRRKSSIQVDWLASLPANEVYCRWKKQGSCGLYMNEREALLTIHPDEEVISFVKEWHDALLERKEKTRLYQESIRFAKENAREEQLATIREELTTLDTMTHGTVRAAADATAELYLERDTPRSLKQCIAIAANIHKVEHSAILHYLAGVGVRVVLARMPADTFVWEED